MAKNPMESANHFKVSKLLKKQIMNLQKGNHFGHYKRNKNIQMCILMHLQIFMNSEF